MWIRKKWLLVLSCCLCVWALAGLCTSVTAAEPTAETVTMSATQYNALKTKFATLEIKLTQLQQNSTTDETQLIELKTQLENWKIAAANAQNSLESANSSLAKLETSLQTLTQQIDHLQAEQARLKRQRNTWAILAGVAMVYAICK